jgi:agmatine deiminase
MITDNKTNFVYLSDKLENKYKNFFEGLKKEFIKNQVGFDILNGTNDIWAVDYMPIQIRHNKFVKFIYNPDYLKQKIWQKTITDVYKVCENINLPYIKSDIILDGGNVIKSKNAVILCEKVVLENKHYSKKRLICELEKLFEVDKIILIPYEKVDYIGHADGIVRFIDDNNVLLNDYSKTDNLLYNKLERIFKKEKLNMHYLPITFDKNQDEGDATGLYINYLEVKNLIFLPVFNIKDDEPIIKKMEQIFSDRKVIPILSNDIARKGGVLNCITWNILKK